MRCRRNIDHLFIVLLGMSVTNFGGTLTSGIQDVSAFLPLLGTEQCEKHVGSALEGGFLYAASTPLSLFGSLGIARAGISVLVASISIPKPSLSFTPLPKLSFTSSRHLWCGARVLNNAGFKLVGKVAPLIGMDEKRYKAESRLIEILEEKHIDTPEKLSIQWRSTEWNTYLVISTIVAALISGTPYLYLLLKDPLESIHSPWVFPFLRTVGSCLVTVCCQFLIQSRVISLMKSRVVFMIMHRLLVDDLKKSIGDQAELILKKLPFQWDESLPAEECLRSLEHYLPSIPNPQLSHSKLLPLKEQLLSIVQYTLCKIRVRTQDLEKNSFNDPWVNIRKKKTHDAPPDAPPAPPDPLFSDPDHILRTLLMQHAEHFKLPPPRLHHTSIVVSWVLLLISLPAAVAGYIGCFTLVSNLNGQSSGPLVWLGLEAVLSALRILLWAWNPSFDEKTGIEVSLKLAEEGPPMTTHLDIDALRASNNHQVLLVPERRFLEQITPYTGPLTRFTNPNNVALYFVLAVHEHTQIRLLMILLDLTDRTAITLCRDKDKKLACFNTSVIPNTNIGEMVATIHWQSLIGTGHRSNNLIHDLGKYYDSLRQSLNRSGNHIAWLRWKWSLVPRSKEETQSQESQKSTVKLTEHDLLCLQQSNEYSLKMKLMKTWGEWIVESVKAMYREGCDANLVLVDPTSDEAKQELYALNALLVQEWTKRELAHLQFSTALEDVLHIHIQRVVNTNMKMSLSIEWSSVQKSRLEYERAQVKVRREDVLKTVGQNAIAIIWQAGQAFIEKAGQTFIEKRSAAIKDGSFKEGSSVVSEATTGLEWFGESGASMEWLKLTGRLTRWNDQWSYEQREMEATIERIRKAEQKQLEQAYKYPKSSAQWADHIHSRFVRLHSAFQAKVSSAMVYDVAGAWTIDVICTVAENSSCRSLINVSPKLIQHIPENDHLLFCSNWSHEAVNLPFIQQNRNRWWEQQKTNSWTFYFSPQGVDSGGQYVYSYSRTIVHIMIFLQTPTRLRLHLHSLHHQYGDGVELLIQDSEGKKLQVVHTAEIYKSRDKFRLQGYDLDQFESGRHELQLVVSSSNSESRHYYCLRDVALEFLDSPSESITSNSTSSTRLP